VDFPFFWFKREDDPLLKVYAAPLETFICVMSKSKMLQESGLITSLHVIESADDHTDVLCLSFRKL
jgi:hypothetical protein